MTPSRTPNDRGAALLSILMIVAVMSVAALTAVDALGRSLGLAQVSSQRSQTMWAAHSTESIGAVAIARLLKLDDDAFRLAMENQQDITLPFERGVIEARLSDDSNCFNLNAIAAEPGDVATVRLRALLEAQGMFPSDARALADSLTDWIDRDTEPRAYGAEDSYYGTLKIPYRAANTHLENLSELRAIKGFTPEVMDAIRSLVCVRPSRSQSALNIETLTEADAPLLMALYSSELGHEDALSVIRARPLSGWQSRDAFLANSRIQSIAAEARNDTIIGVRPTHLRLTARITSGSTQETLHLVYASDTTGKAGLIQRTTGDF
ncbi:type II secretion system minor pseudopilin GspK [Hyphomonas sp.]|uniref:type II secretion system minor pseudopilin GspK n=1 Tax=Hyphomonas sp. TaxID=87 RepID=UPI003D2CDCA7